LTAVYDGYELFTNDISVDEEEAVALNIELLPACTLSDAIVLLQILTGMATSENMNTLLDLKGDGNFGLTEITFILQQLAGTRTTD